MNYSTTVNYWGYFASLVSLLFSLPLTPPPPASIIPRVKSEARWTQEDLWGQEREDRSSPPLAVPTSAFSQVYFTLQYIHTWFLLWLNSFTHTINIYWVFTMCQPCSSYWKHTHIYTDTKLTKINPGLEEVKCKQPLRACWDIGGWLIGRREHVGRAGGDQERLPQQVNPCLSWTGWAECGEVCPEHKSKQQWEGWAEWTAVSSSGAWGIFWEQLTRDVGKPHHGGLHRPCREKVTFSLTATRS